MPKHSNLGKALIRKQNKVVKSTTSLHTTDDLSNLKSVIDQNNLDEFMSLAALANKQFTAERNGETKIEIFLGTSTQIFSYQTYFKFVASFWNE